MRTLLLLLLLPACMATPPATCDAPGTQVATPKAAGCIAIDQGRLLMVRNTGGWTIPAGYIDAGESSSQAAVRETLEEAGVTVMAGLPLCAVVESGFVAHVCATPDTLPTPRPDGSETTDARWFTPDDLRALPASELRFPAQREQWLQAMQGAAAAQKRLESGAPAPE
ncbi:MAG: NUDIX hydrolase [Myxococcota bacterium]